MTRLVPRQKNVRREFLDKQAGILITEEERISVGQFLQRTESPWPIGLSKVLSLAGLFWSVHAFLTARELELIPALRACRRETSWVASFTAASVHDLANNAGV